MDRAYSLLTVKSIDEEKRIIRGIASTPSVDRAGDVVDPMGARFKTPFPLFMNHDPLQVVGTVDFAKPTKTGIPFEASLPLITEPGVLKDRVDEAWHSVKYKLITAVSIGFKPVMDKIKQLKSGGLEFSEWDWLELSLVPIPANAEATISYVKSIDHSSLAAIGRSDEPSTKRLNSPGVTGNSTKLKGSPVKTIAEQIGAFEAKRAASDARQNALMTKSAEENSTLDKSEEDEYDELAIEIKKIDSHLVRLKSLQERNLTDATEVTPANTATPKAAAEVRGGVITVKSNLPKGTAFARYVKLLAQSKGNTMQAVEMAKQYDSTTPEVGMVLRAAVAAGTTTDAAWAAPLVPYQNMTSEFISLLRPATILGKFGINGVPALRQVPFNIKMPTQTGGSTVNWVGQLAPKPVSQLAFSNLTLDFTKTAGIVVISDELARLSTPSAEQIITNDLIEQTAQFLDGAFINPALAAVPGVSPASITNGANAITASGTDANSMRHDLRRLIGTFQAVNLSTAGAVLIMTETQATALSMMVNALGNTEFPNVTALGGTIMGIPVITSENVTQTTGGSPAQTTAPIVMLKASEILLADDGQVTIDVSREASLQMDSAPAAPSAATVMVSLWQMNMVGIRAERWINWVRRRAGSVAYISNANYST